MSTTTRTSVMSTTTRTTKPPPLAPGLRLLGELVDPDAMWRNWVAQRYVFEQEPHLQPLWIHGTRVVLPVPWLQYSITVAKSNGLQRPPNGFATFHRVQVLTCTTAGPTTPDSAVFYMPLPNMYAQQQPCNGQWDNLTGEAAALAALTAFWESNFNNDGHCEDAITWKHVKKLANLSYPEAGRHRVLSWWADHLTLEDTPRLPYDELGPRHTLHGV